MQAAPNNNGDNSPVTDSFSQPQINAKIENRAQQLFSEQQHQIFVRIDRMFGALLVCQWLAGIIVALIVSPRSWEGQQSNVHLHVWMALGLGLAIIAGPLCLIIQSPGKTITRHTIAVAQMLFSALLIHLTGGRLETHFHVFGSLAFLGLYRDWRVLVTATTVVAADHILRGIYFPFSVYGVATAQNWRWVEHAAWVVFEDAVLIRAVTWQTTEMKSIANRQAEVEQTRDRVEDVVKIRTSELEASRLLLAKEVAENAHFAHVVNSSNEPIVGQRQDGSIISWNKGAERVFGYTFEEMRGKNVKILVPSKKQHEMSQLIEDAKNGKTVDNFETARMGKDGKPLMVLITRSPIFDKDRNVIGVSEIMHESSHVAELKN